MGAVLAWEWARARSVRITWVLLGLIAFMLVAGALGGLISITTGDEAITNQPSGEAARQLAAIIAGATPFIAVFQAVIGAQSLDHEYRFGTIRLTVQAFPDRGRLLAGKAVAVFGLAGGATLVASVVAVFAGALADDLGDGLSDPAVWRTVVFAALVGGIWAVIGLGLRVLLGSVALLAVIVALVPLILENLIILPLLGRAGLSDASLEKVQPFLVAGSSGRAVSWDPIGPAPVVGLLAFAVWGLVAFIVARTLFTHRDIRPD